MLIRKPVVAGRFYPAEKEELQGIIKHYLKNDKGPGTQFKKLWGAMLPHAGYIFCGEVIGATLANSKLPDRLIILCPNHTGYGAPLSVWPAGEWQTPLGCVPVNKELTDEILATRGGFQADVNAHLREHSIEVLLPFLQMINPAITIAPICLGTQNRQILENGAAALATVLSRPHNKNVGLVVSSDMNHYENEKTTLEKDTTALKCVVDMNPAELLETVKEDDISMCGAGPMALALMTAIMLGDKKTELVCHATSGKINGDHAHVVGYAGVKILENT